MGTRWALAAVFLLACGGGSNPASRDGGADGGLHFGDGDGSASALEVDPPNATLDIVNGQVVTQAFTVKVHNADGSSTVLTNGVAWSSNYPALGLVDGTGLFTPTAELGGVATINATYQNMKGAANVVVNLHIKTNPANASSNAQFALQGATTKDASCVWAYPYDKTVFPRGLAAPTMMWNGGNANDVYYVHVTSTYFELETFVNAAPPARFALDDATWSSFADSTSGAAEIAVNRFDGTNATILIDQHWTIAPASMRGTIYYWANNLGRVMRIKPGASAPDDFANVAPLNDPNSYVQSSCLMTCHTVSADGSTLVSGGGTYGGSYDLKNNKPIFYTGGTWGAGNTATQWESVQWMTPALSPTGKYMMSNSMADGLSEASGGPGNLTSLYDTTAGTRVANSGLDGKLFAMPAWSPEGSLIAYVDSGDPTTWSQGWNIPNAGDLHAIDFNAQNNPMAGNDRVIVPVGNDPTMRINWPTVSPDGQWAVYGRGATADTRYSNSDLYIGSTQTPNAEARLALVDGDGYPFAAGSRDLSWNFEPTFAPVASGGYFWVVFTSRRTYGNLLTGTKDQVKQLWVAAIDQNPKNGVDASHPAFWLPGQASDSINMRGYWALDPCKGDGQTCGSGTECCGGYCDSSGDGGAAVCSSNTNGCSGDGDHCDTVSDCCGASSGEQCINHVCSAPSPN